MNMSIEKMLSHVYEIEGLMLVTRRLGEENTPDVITNKIQRKVRELAEMCNVELTPQAPPAAADVVQQPASVQEQEKPAQEQEKPVQEQEKPAQEQERPVQEQNHLPEEDYDADETWQHDNGEEFKEVFSLDYEEPEHELAADGKVPVADREPDEDITVEFIEAHDEPEVNPDEPVAMPIPKVNEADKDVEPEPTIKPPVFRRPDDTNDEPVPDPDPAIVPEVDRTLDDASVKFIGDDTVPELEEDMPIPPLPTEFC